jgi:hypothetical protein
VSDQKNEIVALQPEHVAGDDSSEKKPYVAPELTKLGLLRASTQFYF